MVIYILKRAEADSNLGPAAYQLDDGVDSMNVYLLLLYRSLFDLVPLVTFDVQLL